jgi:phage FluMu protein gp41
VGDLTHRTHGLAFVGATLYSVEELTLSQTAGTPPNLYTLNPETGATLATIPLTLSTGESLKGGKGLATEPGTNQLWGLLTVSSEENTFRRLVTINPETGLATQIAKISGRFENMAFDVTGTLYAISDNFPVPGGSPVLPARIYQVNTTTGATKEFLDVSAGAVAGQANFREGETIGAGVSPDLLYHLSGQNKQTPCCTRNILFETIHLPTKDRTPLSVTGPDFFITTALTLMPPDSAPALNDLDANGRADIVWRDTRSGGVAVWLMDGTLIAASAMPGGVPLDWQIAGIGDVDADGKADIIWHNSTNGTVAVWLMSGLAISSAGFPGSAPLHWSIQAIGDVNGDGKADVIWRNINDGSIGIWLMNGDVIASSAFPGGVPLVWQIAGIGDVNGDGKADVIWHNHSSGTVAIWLMNGSAITSVGFPGSASLQWSIQGVGDVNGNGRADLVWRNNNDGGVAVWLMNGTTLAASGVLSGVPLVWHMAGVGDVNGNGRADVIWRNGSTGTVAIWLMNGLTVTAVGFPGSPSTTWEIQ